MTGLTQGPARAGQRSHTGTAELRARRRSATVSTVRIGRSHTGLSLSLLVFGPGAWLDGIRVPTSGQRPWSDYPVTVSHDRSLGSREYSGIFCIMKQVTRTGVCRDRELT